MIDLEVQERLRNDGWAVFDMPDGEGVRGELAERCGEARAAADELMDRHEHLGLPLGVMLPLDIGTPFGEITSEELQLVQVQRDSKEGFGRVSAELTAIEQPTAMFDEYPSDLTDQIDLVRQRTIAAGLASLPFFGLEDYNIPLLSPTRAVLNRLQFIHTWYKKGGYLFGDVNNSRGHTDTPYSGVTLSRHINPEAVAKWTVDSGRGRRTFTQTGNLVVAMTGIVNPYHLVEVPRKAPAREAALLRLTGDPLRAFLG